MAAPEIVGRLMAGDEVTHAEIKAMLSAPVESFVPSADAIAESVDYVVEALLERTASEPAAFADLRGRIAEYWLKLEEIPGGTVYEAVIRAAECLAAIDRLTPLDMAVLQSQAHDPDWRQRLVAAWTVRGDTESESQAVRDLLADDPYQDDNGLFLVREGVGVYGD
mgnify:CR=1 FL=1